VLGVPN